MASILKTFDLIEKFESLPQGWHFGEGVPSRFTSSFNAQETLRFAYDLGYKEAEVFPGITGEIQVCFYNDEGDVLEFIFEANRLATVSVEKEDEVVFRQPDASFRDVIKILKDFTYNKCRSYVLSTSTSTTVTRKSDYPVWLLDPPLQTEAFQLSIGIVPRGQEQIYVPISEDTTQILPDSQSSFGKSQMGEYRLPVSLATA